MILIAVWAIATGVTEQPECLLLENSQIIPNHDDFVEECLEPATAGKLTMPPCPSVQSLRPDSTHRKPLMIDDKLQDLGELIGGADSCQGVRSQSSTYVSEIVHGFAKFAGA
jgi:hypothetical protein